MKVFIAYKIATGASGGGNQFLRTFKNQLVSRDSFTENLSEADVVLVNAHHHPQEVLRIKQLFPDKTFIHRLAGVYKLYNHAGDADTRSYSGSGTNITNMAWKRIKAG